MTHVNFSKAPLSKSEKKKIEDEFLNFDDNKKKESKTFIKVIMPTPLYEDFKKISAKTGLTMNAMCLNMLGDFIRNRKKELEIE